MRLTRFALLFFAATALLARAQTPSAPAPASAPDAEADVAKPVKKMKIPADVELIEDVVTGQGGGQPLHAYVLRPKKPTAKPMPGLIVIHGGGWIMGTYKTAAWAQIAEKGYFIADIEYRMGKEVKWPAHIEDSKLAVRWLRANAAKYNVDPNHIGAMGASAGGHLSACLGTMGDEKQFEGTGGYPGVSSKVQAVVDMCGPIDFVDRGEPYHLPGATFIDRLTINTGNLFDASALTKPEVLKGGSPLYYVKAGDPPFLVIQGDKDKSVPYTQSVKMVAALKKAGVPVDFITVKGGGHGLHAEPGEPVAEPDYAARLVLIQAFLDKNLKP